MTEKKKPTESAKQTPIQTLRRADVGASISRRSSYSGYVYHEFMLTRPRNTSTVRDARAASFFPPERIGLG